MYYFDITILSIKCHFCITKIYLCVGCLTFLLRIFFFLYLFICSLLFSFVWSRCSETHFMFWVSTNILSCLPQSYACPSNFDKKKLTARTTRYSVNKAVYNYSCLLFVQCECVIQCFGSVCVFV